MGTKKINKATKQGYQNKTKKGVRANKQTNSKEDMICRVVETQAHGKELICRVWLQFSHGKEDMCRVLFLNTRYSFSREFIYCAGNLIRYFPRNIGERGKVADLVNWFAVRLHEGARQRYRCRDGWHCRASCVHCAVMFSVPWALGLLCRAPVLYREPSVTCTAKSACAVFRDAAAHGSEMSSRQNTIFR